MIGEDPYIYSIIGHIKRSSHPVPHGVNPLKTNNIYRVATTIGGSVGAVVQNMLAFVAVIRTIHATHSLIRRQRGTALLS
ncbi:hypothetical protein WP8S18E06_26520 [Klebsiella sp. WP8-S18-ESBL-06]|nr:hypothetical protein WP8S18E06_26520 [Klebsiella sp. WP8-S18-ESBL-06]